MTAINFIIAQINVKVGDIDGNVEKIIAAAKTYQGDKNAVVVFPELATIGYPPEDLVLRPHFAETAVAAIGKLAEHTKEELPAIIVGGLYQKNSLTFNAAYLLADGEIKHVHTKSMLPNYGVFDEKRVFARGSAPIAFDWNGSKIGILLCEDAWFEHNFRILSAQQAETIIIINASPFEVGKPAFRIQMYQERAKQYAVKIIYANLVGGQDDIIFDGNSFVISPLAEVVQRFPSFKEHVAEITSTVPNFITDPEAELWNALRLGIHDYIKKNGFSSVLLGLSGGVDSAIVAALAVDALGSEHVTAVLLPSEFTSDESNEDAIACAKLLGIKTIQLPIIPAVDAMEQELIPALQQLNIDTKNWQKNLSIGGNIQSRLRGLHLMSISNATGALLLNTSNKSELAVGYSTLYGDSCGAYAPLKDVYKTEIYKLAAWRNAQQKVIPDAILQKAPSAELAPGQKDSDQLPEYDVLDAILVQLIEQRKSIDEVVASGFSKDVVQRVYHLIRISEYKRKQSAPGPKVSSMHFNRDWRYPLTNGFKN